MNSWTLLLPALTWDNVPRTLVACLVWIDAFDGCPPAPSTNGLDQSHREPLTVRRLLFDN
ncbi:MAG: hypothetical protein HYS05_19990 [Acidobacteria bacterium]|nr:hypothetical protein [Acidobacteriota bacterium]